MNQPSIVDAFQRAKQGFNCPKCEAKIPFHYMKRHEIECIVSLNTSKSSSQEDIQFVSVVNTTSKTALAESANNVSMQTSTVSVTCRILKRPHPVEVIDEEVIDWEKIKGFTFEEQLQKLKELITPKKEENEEEMKDKRKKIDGRENEDKVDEVEVKEDRDAEGMAKEGEQDKDEGVQGNEEQVQEKEPEKEVVDQGNVAGEDGVEKAKESAKEKEGEKKKEEVDLDGHYTVKEFRYICRKVLEHQISDASIADFWSSSLLILMKFWSLNPKQRQLVVWAALSQKKYFMSHRLKIKQFKDQNHSDDFKELHRLKFFLLLEEDKEASLHELMDDMDVDELKLICSKLHITAVGRSEKLTMPVMKEKINKFVSSQKGINGEKLGGSTLKCITKAVPFCYRVVPDFTDLLYSIVTVYSPVMMDTGKLFENPNASLAKDVFRKFDDPEFKPVATFEEVKMVSGIYRNYEDLRKYIDAKRFESTLIRLLNKKKNEKIMDIYEKSSREVEKFLENKKDLSFYQSFPDYLIKYTHIYIHIRCLQHAVEAAQKLKMFRLACDIISYQIMRTELQKFFQSRRGLLYERLTLNLESHLKMKEEALRIIENALHDTQILSRDRLLLQDRGRRITGARNPFPQVFDLVDPETFTIECPVLSKDLGHGRTNMFVTRSQADGSISYHSVEQVALNHMIREKGYTHGRHVEGGIWHGLFGLLCYDVIFDKSIPGVWISEFQKAPLDLNCSSFYEKRKEKFNEALAVLSNRQSTIDKAMKHFEENSETRDTENLEIDWKGLAGDPKSVEEILQIIDLKMLADVFIRFAQEYRDARSGLPDLIVWNQKKQKLAVVEVKGPGDKLSTKQRFWLDFFMRRGTDAFVCRVKGKRSRAQ